MHTPPPPDMVKLRIRLVPHPGRPAGETTWARPVRAHDGGGTYELHNMSFFAALGLEDVVRAELDGDSCLQVTDVVSPAQTVVTAFATADHLDTAEVEAMGDGWVARGSLWSEGSGGLLVTTWSGLEPSAVRAVLAHDERAGRGWLLRLATPEDRRRDRQSAIDFRLDREPSSPPVTTSYWAADDPWWAEHGMGDAAFLAWIQTIAGEDEEVARGLEAGRHEQVLLLLGVVPS